MNGVYESSDYEAIRILEDFLPDRIFDAHAHLYDGSFLRDMYPEGGEGIYYGLEEYRKDMAPVLCNPRTLRLNIITYPDRSMAKKEENSRERADAFLKEQLSLSADNVGELIVVPGDTAQDLEARLSHPGIRGFKCYHYLSGVPDSWMAQIGDYLPEAAWEVANERRLCITLHMVRHQALADPDNLDYICRMACKYPDAVLILAHAARSFASWTGVETVEKLAGFENVWFDLSAVCESPAIFQIMRKTGTERCMWGSDYPVSMLRGKAISLADGFYWIYQNDLDQFVSKTPVHSWLIGTENLMAVRQACILAELHEREIENVFYNNAARLFGAEV